MPAEEGAVGSVAQCIVAWRALGRPDVADWLLRQCLLCANESLCKP
jgi:hypothetical protein